MARVGEAGAALKMSNSMLGKQVLLLTMQKGVNNFLAKN